MRLEEEKERIEQERIDAEAKEKYGSLKNILNDSLKTKKDSMIVKERESKPAITTVDPVNESKVEM